MDETGLMDGVRISIKWPQLSWIEGASINAAIPERWKSIIKNVVRGGELYTSCYDTWLEVAKPVKAIYTKLVSNPCSVFDPYNSWSKEINETIALDRFEDAFIAVHKITISTKLRDFQYCLLHKRLPSNKELYHWKIKSSNLCDFCDTPDSVTHMLFSCDHIKDLWNSFFQYVTKFVPDHEIDKSISARVINDMYAKPTNIVNMLGLQLKQSIYRAKCASVKLTFTQYLSEIDTLRGIEYYNVKNNSCLGKHFSKWQILDESNRDYGSRQELSLCDFVLRYIEKLQIH